MLVLSTKQLDKLSIPATREFAPLMVDELQEAVQQGADESKVVSLASSINECFMRIHYAVTGDIEDKDSFMDSCDWQLELGNRALGALEMFQQKAGIPEDSKLRKLADAFKRRVSGIEDEKQFASNSPVL